MILPDCTGCRVCELACSLHHNKAFNPSLSSIEVVTINGGFDVKIYTQSKDGRFVCDGCKGLDEKLCIKYCKMEKEGLKKLLRTISK